MKEERLMWRSSSRQIIRAFMAFIYSGKGGYVDDFFKVYCAESHVQDKVRVLFSYRAI